MDIKKLDTMFAALPQVIRNAHPHYGLVLGSGWSKAVERLNVLAEVSFGDIPGLGAAGVVGHAGRIVLACIPSKPEQTALIFCGRRHWYEGVGWEAVTYPIDVFRRLKISNVLLTNAAGGIRADMNSGDMVIIKDHLRMSAICPLQGPHIPELGPRFPDQSHVYDVALSEVLRRAVAASGVTPKEGVYAFSSGPVFETPSEVRAYATLGADVVGMSTVPEAIVASACGMKVAALSFVSNKAAGTGKTALSHEEVMETSQASMPKMEKVILEFLRF